MTDFEHLIDVIREAGGEPYSYSGRGMYGRRCVAVNDVSQADLVRACGDVDEVADLLDAMRQDQMGLGHVYYWPIVEWVDGERDEDEEG